MDNRDIKLTDYINECISLMKSAGIVLPSSAKVNIYHHEGVSDIERCGAMFVNIVNHDYCKSYVVMSKEQHYPLHYHRIKMETFYVHYGELSIIIDGKKTVLKPGEMIDVERGQDHEFWTDTGVVFEELSTMYVPNDSMYLNEFVASRSYVERRTTLTDEEWKEIKNNA